MSTALVVQEDCAFSPGHQSITQTPEGRLRVDTGTAGTYDTATAISVGTPFNPGTALFYNCTVAGSATLTLAGSGTVVWTFLLALVFSLFPLRM